MVASDEINFGKAYVTVEARLDEYERQMRDLEQAEMRSVQRVRQAEAQAQSSRVSRGGIDQMVFGPVGLEERMHVLGGAMTATTSKGRMLLNLILNMGRALTRVLWPVALVVEGGRLVQMFRDLPQGAERLYGWLRQLTLTQLVRDVHNFAGQLPIIGHLWNGIAETVSQVSEGLGFANFTRDLREAAEAAAVAENRLAGMSKAAQIVRDTRLIDAAEQSRRSRIMSGLSGADAIRQQELFDQEDLVVMARQAAVAVHEKYTEQLQQLQAERGDGLINGEQYERQLAQLNNALGRQLRGINNELAEAQRAAGGAVAARLGELGMQRAQEMKQLEQDLAQARVQVEREGFDARAEAIRLGYRNAIMAADREGDNQRSQLLQEIARTRVEAVRMAERDAVEARVDEIKRGGRDVLAAIAQVETAIERGRLEMSMPPGPDRDRLMAFFDIDTSAEGRANKVREQIEQMQARQRELTADYHTTSDEMLELKALGDKIDQHTRLLDLLEREAEVQKDLVEQREREWNRGRGGMQISGRDMINYFKNEPATSPVGPPRGTDEGQRKLGVIAENAQAIRKALESGRIGGAILG
jgi:hypothetical protein